MITRDNGAGRWSRGTDRSDTDGGPGNRLIPEPDPDTDNPREES